MDQGMARITQDVKDIVETRTAIADKLEKLEQRFASSVEEAKMIADDFADRTQSVIEDTVDSIREATDPARIVSHYPWVMVSGAIMAGFALGQVFKNGGSAVMPYYPPGSRGANVMPQSGSDTTSKEGVYPFYPHPSGDKAPRPTPAPSSTAALLFTYLGPVIAEGLGQVKGDLVAIGTSALRAWLKEAVQAGRQPLQSADKSRPGQARPQTRATRGEPEQPREASATDA
ncbi:MAG TPA: hypothetical protein PKD12_03805 [Nitrospira sp.]|nr:hypothetical protein [Nitrospira sp.]